MENGNSIKLVSWARTELGMAVRALEPDTNSTSLQAHTIEKSRELKEMIRKEAADLKQRSKIN